MHLVCAESKEPTKSPLLVEGGCVLVTGKPTTQMCSMLLKPLTSFSDPKTSKPFV